MLFGFVYPGSLYRFEHLLAAMPVVIVEPVQ
jgi:hypothetical protein